MTKDPRRNEGANAKWHDLRLRLCCAVSQSRLVATLHVTPRHNGGVPDVVESPLEVRSVEPEHSTRDDRPWIVLVWNDPINLMSYVTLVFQKLFGYSLEKATKLMLDVHEKGRAVVSQGSREKAEIDVYRLHEHGLWATMQKEDSGQL
ncbi:MAG: ATP-dependent Clp protease adapter ClpS [Actinobacteria bacterium]|jgi:ATP-dependent Clp protease adaptor protein ClpS|nr:ATP-dependent Clp protease adapter ClpS [Actinomycetota bacterium]NBT37590.1 ATP-dependent Clp protease adapter ClpS [Actinomycetota bacterium]NBY12996.1 ATP-dependent Clp protease adapter ClpS [Actinomycetota bacterium]NCZ89590.1 ATP-dependent Clp protease adapter ClpS [Actinomycetota bacterium]NCZ93510.1 ATP-dependent Clp protease adapter ClpS [Actinomycetota bacterium]